jgi:hypothetical protein
LSIRSCTARVSPTPDVRPPFQAEGVDNTTGYRRRNVSLQHEEVLHVVIVLLRPDVSLSLDLDELRGNPYSIPRPPDARLKQIVNSQFPSNLVGTLYGVLVVQS